MKSARPSQIIIAVLLLVAAISLGYLILAHFVPSLAAPLGMILALVVLAVQILVAFFVVIPRLYRFDRDYPALEQDRNSLLEYIDAIWKSHKTFIQQEKLDALNTLVGGIAHEINTPLGSAITAISFLEDMVKTKGNLDLEAGKVRELLDLAMRNLRKASSLVVNFKKISAKKVEGEDEVQSVASLLNYVIKLTSHRVSHPLVDIVIECRKELFFNISFTSFSTIIDHVVENALQHAFVPEQKGQITIQVESNSNDLSIAIRDNGKGMNPDTLRQIFDPFYTTNRAGGHFGLGLPIAYNLVFRQFNGEIICESTLGQGSCFIITFRDILIPDPNNCLAV